MKILARLSPLLLFLVLIIFFWRGLYQDPHRIPSPLINKPMPVVPGMTARDFIGQVSLLNIFATWCVSCQTEHTVLMDLARNNRNFLILYGLDYKDNNKAMQQWLHHNGNPYQKIINDPDGHIAINLGVYGTPETFVIDRDGIIRDKYVGPITPEVWQNVLLPEIRRLKNLENI